MRCVVLLFSVIAFAASKSVKDPQISYEGYKVLRVEVPTKTDFKALASFSDIHFWNEGRVGGHADVMVGPGHLKRAEVQLILKNLKYSIMIENVADLIRLEKVIQGDQNQNCPFLRTITLKLSTSDFILITPKCV